MGGYFTFVGNQYRLEIDDQEFFIDLLLYHRQLRCLVAIELKAGTFRPEYAGGCSFIFLPYPLKVRITVCRSSFVILPRCSSSSKYIYIESCEPDIVAGFVLLCDL